MAVFAGQGDAGRSMRLLWRAPGGGSGSGLSVEAIVDAAVAVADRDGMAALSMRAVGERLGRSAMALYTYVPSKAELLDLMYDRVLGEMPSEYPLDAGWRAALGAWARDARELYLAHPWALQVSQARPVLGPNEFAMVEALLRILRPTGLGSSVLRGVVGAVVQFVRGAAGVIAEARRAARETGLTDEEWWFARSGVFEEVAPDFAERFPLSAWLGAEEPPVVEGEECVPYLERDAARNFATGLEVLLDGVEAAVARAGGG
ncbi:TetR/AcrR family transcriptional regulator [Saccharothrix sp. S26]|uniref:TetR/AcrR family transcriptional regulator C-terminal domain-containing protein n=1 Tax=Saccharothrix sp. S26 TaxID=2907215 RepID=UPI001F449CBB|nr:TetR/AcrR family transcriptional regulator C-terminal domain-containing protein [Saccharothrix sp. S26]MCE6997481.1 TetR/AcrR family transcriptional regulator [Saccharothrix sp. S26]